MKLRTALIQVGLRQMTSDIRMYSQMQNGELIGALIPHVGDLLYAGTIEFIATVEKTAKQFRVGDIQILTKEKPTIFSGVEMSYSKNHVVVSREQYVEEIPLMDISQYVTHNKLVKVEELQITFRQGLGAWIWAHQSRPDFGF